MPSPRNYRNLKRLRINANLPVSYCNAESLNERLQQAIRITENILAFAAKGRISDNQAFLKTFKPDLDLSSLEDKSIKNELPKVNLNVFFQIDEYIKSKAKQVTPKTRHVFKDMRASLKAFETFWGKPNHV